MAFAVMAENFPRPLGEPLTVKGAVAIANSGLSSIDSSFVTRARLLSSKKSCLLCNLNFSALKMWRMWEDLP